MIDVTADLRELGPGATVDRRVRRRREGGRLVVEETTVVTSADRKHKRTKVQTTTKSQALVPATRRALPPAAPTPTVPLSPVLQAGDALPRGAVSVLEGSLARVSANALRLKAGASTGGSHAVRRVVRTVPSKPRAPGHFNALLQGHSPLHALVRRNPEQPPPLEALEAEILRLTNIYRRSRGLGLLQTAPSLAEAARPHAVAMAAGTVPIGHDGWDDRSRPEALAIEGLRSAAENVGFSSGAPAVNVPEILVAGWIQSPGHHKNLVGPAFRLLGVSVRSGTRPQDNQPGFFACQIFAG
jgi:uncharacterized protein YkwD